MGEDMDDVFQKLNSIISDKETADNLKNIINNFNTSSTNSSQAFDDEKDKTYQNNTKNNSSDIPNFDINTIIKLKNLMDKFNNSNNDSRANLLLALKPYLTDSKKEKIDLYIKFLKILNVAEALDLDGGGCSSE